MILQKCKRGHYFDSDKFAECPYCSLEKNVVEEKTEDWSKNTFEATETAVDRYEGQSGGWSRDLLEVTESVLDRRMAERREKGR